MYSREIEGEEYSFGVSGKLIMNTLVMYDRQTDSLWGQILGEAISGPLAGTELEYIPAIHTTWEDWKTQHPDTEALVKNYIGDYDPYFNYYLAPQQAGVIGRTNPDDLLGIKEFVVGVVRDGQAAAYPFNVLNEEPVVNHILGESALLVTFNAETGASAVYDRQLGDDILTFTLAEGLTMADEQTGSNWEMMSGMAIDGPLAGEQLRQIKSTNVFWFGWVDWYPDTEVYGEIYSGQ